MFSNTLLKLTTLAVALATTVTALPTTGNSTISSVDVTPQIVKVIAYENYIAGETAKFTARSDSEDFKLMKRQVGNALVCRDNNFHNCILITGVPSGACVPLGSDLDNLASSFGPDGAQDAYIFDRIDCINNREVLGPIRSPGVSDFNVGTWHDGNGVGHSNFNDRMSSYQLFY